jgi:hypothetical protein
VSLLSRDLAQERARAHVQRELSERHAMTNELERHGCDAAAAAAAAAADADADDCNS